MNFPTPLSTGHLRRRTGRVTGALLSAGLLSAGLVATASPALADEVPPGRKIIVHTVRPGDTATELAVKYHAWTNELISLNHLGSTAALTVGDRIRIPVVRSAASDDSTPTKPASKKPRKTGHHTDPSREQVRNVITDTARRHGVNPHLALAVAWQESGWQMHHVSSARAIGAMQVLPTTGEWMSLYAGRSLALRNTQDNVLAGVLLLDLLGDQTSSRRHQVGAYYQGLGAVREHGLFDETHSYVRNVMAIKRRLESGGTP
ncbi:transglycosylase SLT domain-containing protein [Nocardioides sp. JQ2195]|uniref:transglycosylase SLT domain-containing protein n=1 Tax=Nocardioides sp. JQ2195 TaxID=2592334 RepID=UPI00143E3A42|nr:transglycosylase SLT domain-containing protein [Nocardioides sp. JQ2195]QIX26334.1 transglycosylase SLT domain-containing protein [Nocardioides sp. JQ2195]